MRDAKCIKLTRLVVCCDHRFTCICLHPRALVPLMSCNFAMIFLCSVVCCLNNFPSSITLVVGNRFEFHIKGKLCGEQIISYLHILQCTILTFVNQNKTPPKPIQHVQIGKLLTVHKELTNIPI